MKKILIAAFAALAAAASPALAADMRMPMKAAAPMPIPVFSWTGFDIGANGGYGGDRVDYNFAVLAGAGTASITSGGGFGGGQAGYNHQFGNFVLGIEGDIQASDIRGEINAAFAGIAVTAGSKIDWFATARGRLGYAWDRVLLYATGGYAYADVSTGATLTIPGIVIAPIALAANVDTSHHGWVIGGGIEYAFTNNLTFKTEYQYLDFERRTLATIGTSFIDVQPTVHTVRGGLNFKF
jgi:outer membrane immunogenic protein